MCVCVCVLLFTCVYLLTEEVSQNIIIDVMNQDKTAVVREDVLFKLLQLLDRKRTECFVKSYCHRVTLQ